MKKRIGIIAILFLLFNLVIVQKSIAKYTIQDTLELTYYLDKTPPIIHVVTSEGTESFNKSETEIVKKSDSITIHTSDNVEIEKNEYSYNPNIPNFEETATQQFEDDQEFTEEGYYKIVTTDTSGNVTQIVILIDKTAPEVWVKYFKKGELTSKLSLEHIRKTAALRNYRMTENIVNTTEELGSKEAEQVEENEEIMLEGQLEALDTPVFQGDTKIEDEIMVLSGDVYVGNEAEFRNALANQAPIIHIRQSIDFYAPIYINYTVTIVNESAENALRYKSNGNFMNIQAGGSLTVDGIVVDTNSSGIGGVTAINIQSGGCTTLINSAIIDGGLDNTGVLINGGGSLVLWSCEIVRCGLGVNLQADGKLLFATQQDRSNNFYWNKMAVFIDNFYGICDFNQNISMHDNTEYGIYVANSRGTITVSAGYYHHNLWAISVGGSLNLTGGYIYSNDNGIIVTSNYFGKFEMTGGSIYYNKYEAIFHTKTNDGGCTITGGQVHGEIYLAENDNYVNTNSSYPAFTVTPSTYYFKRKLVKTNSQEDANVEITKFILTVKDSWYKYVDNEYVVLWSGGNVIAQYRDYYGNILKQEILNGTIGENYSITPPIISGYDLVEIPLNAQGVFTQDEIIVDFKYDLVNIAKVTFEDLLSGVISAKYWYNSDSESFSGDGIDFANGAIFENYGYYKVMVTNGVGLQKEVIFMLNKNSITR